MRTDVAVMLAMLSIVIAASWLLLAKPFDVESRAVTTLAEGRDSVKLPAAESWGKKRSFAVSAGKASSLSVHRTDATYYTGEGLRIEPVVDELQPGEMAAYRVVTVDGSSWWTREVPVDELRKKGVIR